MESATALLAGLMAFAAPGDILDTYRWQARPILVFADADDPRLSEQMAQFAKVAGDLRERRNIVIVDTNGQSALRRRFGPDGFTVILVGLDGGEKARERGIVSGGVFNDAIDAMPMRRWKLDAD